ncbi:MAG: BamA/TamA family outer membrane protein [Gemmatimonadetes bacterium]|nr:BamA/TamA family outer membrane protein [Gemmatimonadota bacterium]
MILNTCYNRPRRRRCTPAPLVAALIVPVLLAASLTLAGADSAAAQAGQRIFRSIPAPGDTTHVAVPGGRFEKGGFGRWFYGSDYRQLWTTPLELPVLDLDAVGGGLSPMRPGGAGQSISLHFMGEDGRRYTVRSIDKDPSKRLLDELKDTVVEDVIQDLVSAHLPAAGLVVDALMEATGVLHAPHRLVVIPDDPRLESFREEYAGLIGTLQEHPSEAPGNEPGFAGSRRVSGTERLYEGLEESPCERVDARAYLKARLIDFLIGDSDRHRGQWRWAQFPAGDCYTWLPVPEDRDKAFIDLDGQFMKLVRRIEPKFVRFQEEYPNHKGLSRTGWELDRQLLAELEWSAWDEVVATVQSELPDPVIDEAVKRLPDPFYTQVGDFLARTLKVRRDTLGDFAARYYGFISNEVEIRATDEDEYLELEHRADGALEVRISLAGTPDIPYFRRTLYPHETEEVRIYLHGGDDQTNVVGDRTRIKVHVDGGGGDDAFANNSRAGRGTTRFYDARGRNRFEGGRAHVNERRFVRPRNESVIAQDIYTLDWGRVSGIRPVVYYKSDFGFYAGLQYARLSYGYRKAPYAARYTIDVGVASRGGAKPFVTYSGRFRHMLRNVDGQLEMGYSGINMVRFNGFGNDYNLTEDEPFYELEQAQFLLAPALSFTGSGDAHGKWNLTAGPVAKITNTSLDENEGKYIASYDTPLYGTGSFGQAGVRGEVVFDTRDHPAHARRGARIRLSGELYPALWDVESIFGNVAGEASTYLSANIPASPTLALRVGGKTVLGEYPFHEAAAIGGSENLRGFRKFRFAGDSAVYGNGELRFRLTPIKFLVPGDLGAFGAVDVGRVFYGNDPGNADNWHIGRGGGLWVSFTERRATLSLAMMDSKDKTELYLYFGFMF